jgi:hypothetical protein
MADERRPSDDDGLHAWCVALVEDHRARRRPWEATWWENIATYAGELWLNWDIHRNRLREPLRKVDHRVRLPINLAQPAVRTELAKLTKNRPLTDVLARSNEESDLNAAEVGDRLLNDYAEREYSLPRVRRRMLQWVFMCGLGGIFTDHDPTAGDTVEFFFTANGSPVLDPRVIREYRGLRDRELRSLGVRRQILPLGDLQIREVAPMAMGWDMSRIFVEDASWIYIDEVYDTEEIKRRWGREPDSDRSAQPGVIERQLLAKFDLTGRLTLNDATTQRLVKVTRLFMKPNRHSWFPDGAHIAFTDSEMIARESYPYEHRQLPLSVMGHIPFPISPYPMSILQQLRGPVLEISRTASQLIENRNLMSNPPWRIPKQLQIKGETLQNRPGARIEYTHVPTVPPPEPVQMPDMPSYVKELIPLFKDFIQLISGQGETSQGQSPAGVRSGVQIAYLQEADDTRLGPTVQEYEETWERVAWQILQLMAEKFTLPRTVIIYRRHSENEVMDFVNTMLEGVGGVITQAGSALPRSKAAKQQFILDLWDRRLEQDPRKVRQMLELSEGEPDEWEVDLAQASRENREMLRGGRPPVLEWYNHPAHHYEHRRWMKEAGFEELPREIRNVAYAHDALHSQFEQRQEFEKAKMQQMLAGTPGESGPPPPNGTNNDGGAPPEFREDIPPSSVQEYEPQ